MKKDNNMRAAASNWVVFFIYMQIFRETLRIYENGSSRALSSLFNLPLPPPTTATGDEEELERETSTLSTEREQKSARARERESVIGHGSSSNGSNH
jgi:hypothetical protein